MLHSHPRLQETTTIIELRDGHTRPLLYRHLLALIRGATGIKIGYHPNMFSSLTSHDGHIADT